MNLKLDESAATPPVSPPEGAPTSTVSSSSSTRTASTDSTTPTRVPPMRTSLFGTIRAAFGTTTETRYTGTNGRPLLAL